MVAYATALDFRKLRIGHSDSLPPPPRCSNKFRGSCVIDSEVGPHGHHLDTRDAYPCSSVGRRGGGEGWGGGTSEESALRSLGGSGVSVDQFGAGALALVACLAEDARLASSGKALWSWLLWLSGALLAC